jgi:hypothetical protein
VHELAGDVKIDARSAEGLARFHGELHRACGGGYQLERTSLTAWRLTLDGTRPFPAPREELRRALFEFQINSGRVLNGHLRLTREPTETGERWSFEDTGRWLW